METEADYDTKVLDEEGPIIKGKGGHIWSLVSPPMTRTAIRNVVQIPHAKGKGLNIVSEKDAFDHLIDTSLIDMIVTHTNQEIFRRKLKYNSYQRFLQDTNSTEILELIGLLYAAGSRKDGHLRVQKCGLHMDHNFINL